MVGALDVYMAGELVGKGTVISRGGVGGVD